MYVATVTAPHPTRAAVVACGHLKRRIGLDAAVTTGAPRRAVGARRAFAPNSTSARGGAVYAGRDTRGAPRMVRRGFRITPRTAGAGLGRRPHRTSAEGPRRRAALPERVP